MCQRYIVNWIWDNKHTIIDVISIKKKKKKRTKTKNQIKF